MPDLSHNLTCPHCGEKLKMLEMPEQLTWGAYQHVCFNDDCPYFVKGWQWLWEHYEVKSSYRYRVTNPETGSTQSNPLATRVRFNYATRDEGQVKLPNPMYLNIRVGKDFEIGRYGRFEAALDIFNLFNWNDFQQYTYNGANQLWNPNYLVGRSMQAARAFQVVLTYRF